MLQLEHVAWGLPDGSDIIKDVSFTLQSGRLVVVTGPNGGGKTSLAKLIAGIETPSGGRILLEGEDITPLDMTERAKRGIAYAFQQPVRFKGLLVRDLLGKVGLCAEEYVDRELSAALSGGEMKRIEIASALARQAKLTIFDEPEAGIDLWSFSRLVQTFEELRGQGNGTLLIISHQERILSIADDIIVVADGRVRTAGPRGDILPGLLAGEHTSRCPRGKEAMPRE